MSTLWSVLIIPALLAVSPPLFAAEDLHIGYNAGGSVMAMLVIEEKMGEKVGSHPEYTVFVSTADGLNALNVGKIDVGASFGTCAPLTFITQGADFVIIAGNLSGGHPIISKPEKAGEYASIEGFRNKTVGSPRLYTADVVWRGALHKAGLDVNKDLNLIEFRRPLDVLEAVNSGKIDVGVGSGSVTATAKKAGLAFPMFSNDLFPHHPCCRIVTTRKVLKEKRPELVRYIKSLLLAEQRFNEDPEAAVRSSINQMDLSEDIARVLVLESHQEYSIDPNTHGVLAMWDYMKACDYIKEDVDLDPRDFIDTSLYQQALAEMKTEFPSPFWEELEARFKEWNE